LSQRIEPAVEQPKISQPEKDKYGHPILECVDCHETQGIIGRGRCAKCYWRLPDVKSKKAKRLESKKIEGLSAESAEGAEREKKAPTTGPGRPKGAAKQSVKVSVADSPSSALSIPSVVKRRTAHNRKPPAKVLCPCGVVFEVHPPWLASVKKYHAPECRSIYGNRRVHPKFTPEQDAEIAAVYREQANTRKDQAPVRALAKKMGLPRWKVSKRAQKLGLVSVNRYSPERVWTEAEMEILKAHAGVSYERIQVKLRAAGFVRGQAAIQLKIKRTIGYKPREGYTARSLAKLFGIDDHSITAWIEKGLLKAEHRGRRRTAAQGGDQWLLQEEDVRSFVIKHVEVVDFRKLDKFWLVELLTAETEKSFTAETGKSFTAEDAEDAEKFQGLDDNPMLAVGLGPAGMTCRRCRSYVRGHKFCLEYTNSRSIVAANYRVHAEEWAACALFEFGNLTCGEIQRQEAARKAIPGAFSGHRIEEPLLGANDCGRGGLVLRKRGSAKAAGACAT
jgi:transposase